MEVISTSKEVYYKMFNWYAVETFEKEVNDWIKENKDRYHIIGQKTEIIARGKVVIVIEYKEVLGR